MVHGSYIFFFKQKTAYEMRISDWSSDVCSSDLKEAWTRPAGLAPDASVALWPDRYLTAPEGLTERVVQRSDDPQASDRMLEHIVRPRLDIFRPANPNRSEEHTSELQSLMRISYAVFCLKKKKKEKEQKT